MFLWYCIACKFSLQLQLLLLLQLCNLSLVYIFFSHGVFVSSYCRSSNRDPGARAADSLSPKDHEGVSLVSVNFVNDVIVLQFRLQKYFIVYYSIIFLL